SSAHTSPVLRPIRAAPLLPNRMNAADTSASSAIADWTPLTVASRSLTTDEIDTFISDVSTTRNKIAIDSRIGSRLLRASVGGEVVLVSAMVAIITRWSD